MQFRKALKLIAREALILLAIILITQSGYIFHIVSRTLGLKKALNAQGYDASSGGIRVVHVGDELWYLKKRSSKENIEEPFFLHVYPCNRRDMILDDPSGYDNLDSSLVNAFDSLPEIVGNTDYIFAVAELPSYVKQKIQTGQYNNSGTVWELNIAVPGGSLTANEYERIFSPDNLLAEAKGFGVYIFDNKIYYLNRNPSPADKSDEFFLHVFPEDVNDLVPDRRQSGFDNLDFKYANCNALSLQADGMSNSLILYQELPGYEFERIETGQFNTTGRTWEIKP